MILMVVLSCIFFLTIAYIVVSSFIRSNRNLNAKYAFLPKSRTEMIKGIAAVAIVFSHIASYSKGSAPSGLLRYYNLILTTLGGIGVNLFFFISGYGNFYSVLNNRKHLINWLWKRCATLLIMYMVCLVIVLGGLCLMGYQATAQGILSELLHLTIPYSSVWYVKIQLLAYGFLVVAVLVKKRNYQTLIVAILCLLSSILLFSIGLDEKWWKSTMCFAAGVFFAAYRPEVEDAFSQHKKALFLGSIALFPVAYVGAVLIDAYLVKTLGNFVLCLIMIALVQLLQMDNTAYYKLGSYSLPLYLTHRSFVAWTLDDGVTTVVRVAMIVVFSVVMTVIANWMGNLFINKFFRKTNK